jgi:Uma2 family endonuclease
MSAATATTLITAEEFVQMPQPLDGSKQELVRGEILTMPPTKQEHGLVQSQIVYLLKSIVSPNRLGWVGSESGIITERDPDSVRGPDVYFFSLTRMPNRPTGYPEVAPDLAVEIRSPDDRPSRRLEKIREYLAAGVRMVWDVNPEDRTVIVYTPQQQGVVFHDTDTLTGGEVLPGFTCQVSALFE